MRKLVWLLLVIPSLVFGTPLDDKCPQFSFLGKSPKPVTPMRIAYECHKAYGVAISPVTKDPIFVVEHLDIKDQDRLFLIFLIRELTFQEGNGLSVNVRCSCGQENAVELKKDNFVYHEIDEKLGKFYNKGTGSYQFKTINNKSYELTPPNIGLQKAFSDYILRENNEKRTPNLAFLKIIPFMLTGRSNITYDGVKAKLKEFEDMDDISFQFFNAAVGKMTFGIKELKKNCSCGEEVHTEMQFPNGASGIFVIHDAFEAFIKE